MLFEATIAMLLLMGGMWGAAVWASFQEEPRENFRSVSFKKKIAA